MEITRSGICFLCFVFLFISCQADIRETTQIVQDDKEDFVLGEVRHLYSEILDEQRTVNVYLPEGYGLDPFKKYPVIYLLDGSKDEDFIHIAGLAQFANFPWTKLLEPSIIIGIANVDRKRDFTYPSKNTKDNEELPTSGGSAKFIEFIESELQPFISKTYSTSENLSLIGQSLGGLLATEILYKKPSMFTNYIIVSPSLWWDDQSLLAKDIAIPFENKKTVYLAVGKEGEVMETAANELNKKLQSLDSSQINFHFDYLEDADHANILHLAVYRALERFFKC